MTDEEIEVMHSQAKERQELPATLETKREARNRFSSGDFREIRPHQYHDFQLLPSRSRE